MVLLGIFYLRKKFPVIDIKTIQHFLGHSQASTTVNIYLHSIANGTVDAANAIGSMVNVGTAC